MSTLTSDTYTHHTDVSSSRRTIAAAITPATLTRPNQRRRGGLEMSAGPQVTAT